MTCQCYDGHLGRGRDNILLLGERRPSVYDNFIFVNCIRCGCGEEIYNRELNDVPAKTISVESMKISNGVFVREYQYILSLIGSAKVKDDAVSEMIVAVIDAYRTNYYMYWERYLFENVRKAIVTVLSSKKYDDCGKNFLTLMKRELEKTAGEPFDLEEFILNASSGYFDEESQKKYGPAGVRQMGCAEGQTYNEKYLERKVYQRTKHQIKGKIFRLQKGIVQKMVQILHQNYKCKDFGELKVDRKISLATIKSFVNHPSRDSIFLRGYSIVFQNILNFEFSTSKDINERNYKEKIEKLEKVDWFVSKYLNK